jgi:ABC-type transport system substrate-binding protein
MKMRYFVLFVLISLALTVGGCDGYYTAYPGYGPNYGSAPYYGRSYARSVNVAVYDRPYYRGPGYWSGNVYYVWKPGHWVWRNGQKVWIRGHYVVRRR